MNKEQLLDLNTELTADPIGRGYAAMSDQQALDSLHDNIDRLVNYPVALDSLNLAIRESGKWVAFSERSQFQTTSGLYDNPFMYEFMSLFSSVTGENPIDLQSVYMGNLLNACVAEGTMGQGVADAIAEYGETFISRDTELGFGSTITDITYARTL